MAARIKESLIALLDGIKRSDGEAVAREIARLDEFTVLERGTISPQLAHFLGQRSYAKALAHLQEGSAPAGSCGGKRG